VTLLSGSLEQRLIGRVLYESVLEDVLCLWWAPSLIEELGFHELAQPVLQAGLVHRRKRLEHFVLEFASEHGAELGHLAQFRQAVKPGDEGFLQGGWNRDGRQRTREIIAITLLPQQPGF
jgi:hypothetical protein